uniref:serpin B12-like n=1 Tax=Podarcis muralis TaxID=64176 RepID=UPI0010A0699A|nr:serpin B12-like [Podarcis muralis]
MTTLRRANARFAVNLFKNQIIEDPHDNLVVSPVNLTAGLGLLAYASGWEQAAQIEKVLHWDEVKEGDKPRSRSLGQSTTRLRRTQGAGGAKPRPRPEPKPCDKRRVIHRPAPCPEPEPEPRCPRRDVPCYECEKPEGIHTAFSKILATLNEPSANYTLSFANKLYGNKDIAFIQATREIYYGNDYLLNESLHVQNLVF